jgi:hypothetical protein
MTLDEQLRAALSQEADMQTVPRPDVDELISGGRVRRRRRNQGRVAVAAAVAVLLAGGAYGVSLMGPATTAEPAHNSEPSQSAAPQTLSDDGGSKLEPDKTYRMLAGVGATGAAIEADLTANGTGWSDGNFPTVSNGSVTGGVGVYRPQALAAGSACTSDTPDGEVAATSPALAEQLSQLPRSTVVQAPNPQRAFGRDTLHLRLRVNTQCGANAGYLLAETVRGTRGISYSDVHTEVVIDFWVMDVDGVPVVVDAWHQAVAPGQMVDQIDLTRESVTFATDQ